MTAPRDGGNRFARALTALRRALARLKITGAIIGGVAINANGIARFTEDIDATISGAGVNLPALLDALKRSKIVPRIHEALPFARANQVLLLHHSPSGIAIDLSLAWLDFELEAIAEARDLTFGSVALRAARPEDLVIYKLIAARPQDLADAERLLLRFHRKIDLERVRRVLSVLAEVLDGPSRVQMLDRLLVSLPARPTAARKSRTRRRR